MMQHTDAKENMVIDHICQVRITEFFMFYEDAAFSNSISVIVFFFLWLSSMCVYCDNDLFYCFHFAALIHKIISETRLPFCMSEVHIVFSECSFQISVCSSFVIFITI